MLVWDDLGARASQDVRNAYEGYLRIVNSRPLGESERLDFEPNKLSAAMIGAFKAMRGPVVDAVETCYAQWQQYVVCALQAVARRSREASARPVAASAPVRSVRRVKAFFISQKVNGRNAP